MNIEIHGDDFKVTEAIDQFARKKLDKLDRYLPNISTVRLDLAHHNTRRGEDIIVAQITVRHRRGALLRSEERVAGDVQLAISQAIEKMYRQIERFKGKRIDRKRERIKERYIATEEELSIAEEVPVEAAPPTEPEIAAVEVLRRKQVAVAAMNEDEAIEQMELLGHAFFMFYNSDTGSVNVLYKRQSGGYGVLIPQVE